MTNPNSPNFDPYDLCRVTPLQWADVNGAPDIGTAEERAEKLLATMRADKDERVLTKYERRCLALDLTCASFPPGHPPSRALVEILRMAMELPDDHQLGVWAIGLKDKDGHVKDRRGSARGDFLAAIRTEVLYFNEHGKPMSDRQLEKELIKEIGPQAPSRRTLRTWRKDPEYTKWAHFRWDTAPKTVTTK